MRYLVIEESTATAFERALNCAMDAVKGRNGTVYNVYITTPTYGIDERRYAFVAVIEYGEREAEA